MSDFVVRIDTGNLNDTQAAAIAGAIQGAVFSELGKLDLRHGGAAKAGGVPLGSIVFHPEWRGLWILSLKDLQQQKPQVLTVEARGG